jgi:hypothetical protein
VYLVGGGVRDGRYADDCENAGNHHGEATAVASIHRMG